MRMHAAANAPVHVGVRRDMRNRWSVIVATRIAAIRVLSFIVTTYVGLRVKVTQGARRKTVIAIRITLVHSAGICAIRYVGAARAQVVTSFSVVAMPPVRSYQILATPLKMTRRLAQVMARAGAPHLKTHSLHMAAGKIAPEMPIV